MALAWTKKQKESKGTPIFRFIIVLYSSELNLNHHCTTERRIGVHEGYSDCNWTWTHKHFICKQTLHHLAKLALNDWAELWVLICTMHLTVCSCHVTYAFQSESTLFSCMNVKELLARNRCKIWSLNDCNWTQTHNHLVCKQTLNRHSTI